jgi:hypothetical protein
VQPALFLTTIQALPATEWQKPGGGAYDEDARKNEANTVFA